MSTVSEAQWDDFVRAHAAGSFFHLSAWRGVIRETFGHKSHPLSVERDGKLAAILPLVEIKSALFGHSLVSNAFCVGGGPLAVDDAARLEVLDAAHRLGQKLGVDYVELRDTPDAADGWLARTDLYANFKGPIAVKEEDNLTQIPRKQRAVVRKALKTEFEVTIDRHTENFFPVYATTMRDHGTPALPRRYFDQLLTTFGPECEILTVHHKGRPISSVLNYYFGDAVLPYYTGSHNDARALGANDMMYWSVMRRAVELGYGAFDFGRSKVGTGPYAFKHNWGFEPRPMTTQFALVKATQTPNLNPTNPRYELMISTWRKLPVPVANIISPFISRSLG